jgi:hypothetical protein
MSKLVCIDSQIFIWGIKQQAIASQKHLIPIATNFIEWLTENDHKILLPNPLITEILSPVPANEHKKILDLIDKRFIVAPFDNLASMKCAELTNIALTAPELIQYREANSVPKSKIKFDCMIVAIAITKRAACIYSEDPDLKRFAAGQIQVLPLPNIGKQGKLFPEEKLKNHGKKEERDEDAPF